MTCVITHTIIGERIDVFLQQIVRAIVVANIAFGGYFVLRISHVWCITLVTFCTVFLQNHSWWRSVASTS